MEIRTQIEHFVTTLLYPGARLEWTQGYVRHCPPGKPWLVYGNRLIVLDRAGRTIDVVSDEELCGVFAKLCDRYRVKLIEEEQRRRRARLPRAVFPRSNRLNANPARAALYPAT